jgi:hypothetical protein
MSLLSNNKRCELYYYYYYIVAIATDNHVGGWLLIVGLSGGEGKCKIKTFFTLPCAWPVWDSPLVCVCACVEYVSMHLWCTYVLYNVCICMYVRSVYLYVLLMQYIHIQCVHTCCRLIGLISNSLHASISIAILLQLRILIFPRFPLT